MTKVQLSNSNITKIRKLINLNFDARHYFFTRADERWLDWLWENGFLDVIKKKAEDPTRFSYTTPELNYLDKVTTKKPEKVTDIMLTIPISSDNFNPEVVDRFSRICSILPAEQLKRIVSKIRDERWIPLMSSFNQWGFEYEKMLKTLEGASDYDSIIILAEAILTIQTKSEMDKKVHGYTDEDPFYFSDLGYTKIFEYLIAVDEIHKEKALEITINTLRDVILTGKTKDEKVFEVSETFHLYDVDFFELEFGKEEHITSRDDVHSLAATVKALTVSLIDKKCNDIGYIQGIYKKFFAPLPDSSSLWRFRLFVLSLCPLVFKAELKQAFFRIFETDYYYELITGTEYKKALQKGFAALEENDRRGYVRQIFDYFSKKVVDPEEQKWRTKYALQILSCIYEQLTPEEREKCEKLFGKGCDPKYEPKPAISGARFGAVRPRGPVTSEEFGKLSIADIAQKLRNEWKPENLRSKNTSDDFLNPLNAEGVGTLLKEDLVRRLQDYITNAHLFFERYVLDAHYTYSLFRGIEEIFREKKVNVGSINWDGLIKLYLTIKGSGKDKKFDNMRGGRNIYGGWLADWTGAHSVMADVLLKLMTEIDGKLLIDFNKNRDDLLSITSYFLVFDDPTPENEKIDGPSVKVKSPGNVEQLVNDPYSNAINSVRGRAFQVLSLFIFLDGKKYSKKDIVKIATDVKKLYEEVLNQENTQALMFMFGHYLPSFYYRDKEWIRSLLPRIFPIDAAKKDLYVAAWEGYLSINLYEEMFFDPAINKLYERAIKVLPSEYTKRHYVKELDEGLATHLALAFMYYNDFSFNDPLFKAFWANGNSERYGGFISFIGRSFVSGYNKQSDNLIKENPTSRQKLHDFWDWALEYCVDIEALKEFGFWMNTEKGVFDMLWQAERAKKTLEKTKGAIEWDYGLTKSISVFAKSAPSDTLDILRLFLLENGVRSRQIRMPFFMDNEWFEAFQTLYHNKDTKAGTYTLIDDLIREGGSAFWKLKDALSEKVS